jgi:hypothetical protein
MSSPHHHAQQLFALPTASFVFQAVFEHNRLRQIIGRNDRLAVVVANKLLVKRRTIS